MSKQIKLPKGYHAHFATYIGWDRWQEVPDWSARRRLEWLVNNGLCDKRENDGKTEYRLSSEIGIEYGIIPF